MSDVLNNRFIGLRCPKCGATSPTIDQQVDIRRTELQVWWQMHLRDSHPRHGPQIERRAPVGEPKP